MRKKCVKNLKWFAYISNVFFSDAAPDEVPNLRFKSVWPFFSFRLFQLKIYANPNFFGSGGAPKKIARSNCLVNDDDEVMGFSFPNFRSGNL
jgi:hypothetical protein